MGRSPPSRRGRGTGAGWGSPSPGSARGKVAVALGRGAGKGAELGGFPAGPLVPRGMPTGRRGLWPLLQAPLAPLPPSERARLPPHAGLCLCSCPAWSRNAVPAGCPSGGSLQSPSLGSAASSWVGPARPPPLPGSAHISSFAVPRGLVTVCSCVQTAVVSLHPPGCKEMRAGRGLAFFLFCWQDLGSLTRDRTQACCTGSAESFLGTGLGDGPRPILSTRASQGHVCASLSVSAAGRLQNRPPTQGGSGGQLPTALHVLLGPNVENLGGRQLGALGPAGKAAREELASEAADQGGRSQWKRREGAQGRDGAEGLEAGRGGSRSTAATSAGQRGSAAARLCSPGPPPASLGCSPSSQSLLGAAAAKQAWGRGSRPCLESAGTQGARMGPGPGSRPTGLS